MKRNSFFLLVLIAFNLFAVNFTATKEAHKIKKKNIDFKDLPNKEIINLSLGLLRNDCKERDDLVKIIDSRVKIASDQIDQLNSQFDIVGDIKIKIGNMSPELVQKGSVNKLMNSKNKNKNADSVVKLDFYDAELKSLIDLSNKQLNQLNVETNKDKRAEIIEELIINLDNVSSSILMLNHTNSSDIEELNKKKDELNNMSCSYSS